MASCRRAMSCCSCCRLYCRRTRSRLHSLPSGVRSQQARQRGGMSAPDAGLAAGLAARQRWQQAGLPLPVATGVSEVCQPLLGAAHVSARSVVRRGGVTHRCEHSQPAGCRHTAGWRHRGAAALRLGLNGRRTSGRRTPARGGRCPCGCRSSSGCHRGLRLGRWWRGSWSVVAWVGGGAGGWGWWSGGG